MESKTASTIEKAYREAVNDFTTDCGISVKKIYTQEDVQEVNPERDMGIAGAYPFTRGHHPLMYRGKLWNIRQITGLSTPKRLNERLKFEIKEGASALDYHIDGTGSYGLDPDQPTAEGQVGVCGVASSTVDDVAMAVEGLPLDELSLCFVQPFPTLVQAYLVAARRMGYQEHKLRIVHPVFSLWYPMCHRSYQEDLYVKDGLSTLGRWSYDFCEYALKHLPKCNLWHFDGPSVLEGGGNAIHEMAFVLASRNELIREMLKRGFDINTIGERLSPTVGLGRDFFENIAKVRALRRLWARTMKEEFGATSPAAMSLRVHVNVIGGIMTQQQPLVNIARGAIGALSGVLAGCQGLQVACYDEPFATPTEDGVKLAIRTQQVIRYESGVAKVIDPLGGSYYVEWLTSTIEKSIEEMLTKIEGMGGWMAALQKGWVHKELDQRAVETQRREEDGDRLVVGVNCFRVPPEEDFRPPEFAPDDTDIEAYVAEFQAFKNRRDRKKVKESLENLSEAARHEKVNLVPYVFDALEADATFPEIIGVMRMNDGLRYDWAGERDFPFQR